MNVSARGARSAGVSAKIDAKNKRLTTRDDPFVTLIVRLRLAPALPEAEADSPHRKPSENDNAGSEAPNPVQ